MTKVIGFAVVVLALGACAEAVPSTPDQTHPVETATPLELGGVVGPTATGTPTAQATIATPPPPPPPVPRSPYAYAADDDPSDDLVVGPPAPRPTCADDLAKA
ncbi:MAG TPA: hypothetical protein VF407_11505, partial [Polyangiaceae bacterium]